MGKSLIERQERQSIFPFNKVGRFAVIGQLKTWAVVGPMQT